MNGLHLRAIATAALLTLSINAVAGLDLTYGGAGSDGALVFTDDNPAIVEGVLTIDLREALMGDWDHEVTAPELTAGSDVYGRGVYDAARWAVVFKYTAVSIPAGVTIQFINHSSRAPVVWLVQGDVQIDGTVSLNGQGGQLPPLLSEPGPGGFRGGSGYFSPDVEGGPGLGSGGGTVVFDGNRYSSYGGGGSYATSGGVANAAHDPAPTYGTPALLPLIGGSGGGGDTNVQSAAGGGAGAGAILLATPGTVTINGTIQANGGNAYNNTGTGQDYAGAGSGGAIRIVTSTLTGSGTIQTLGGTFQQAGGLGRIRIERETVDETSGALVITPAPSVVALADQTAPQVWPPADAPTVRVVSIGGEGAPADPKASFGAVGADVALPEVTTAQVVVETVGVEAAAQVFVRSGPRQNAPQQRIQATLDQTVSADPLVIRWIADVPVAAGYHAVQIQVVRP